jgi:hypothetical protein
MADFVIVMNGERGRLLVDGEVPELFGDVVGWNLTEVLPKISLGVYDLTATNPISIKPPRLPVVDVTLRLPLGPSDHLALVRGTEIRSVHGPSGDTVVTGGDAPREGRDRLPHLTAGATATSEHDRVFTAFRRALEYPPELNEPSTAMYNVAVDWWNGRIDG